MAFRTFLHLGGNTCRCIFSSIQFKSKSHIGEYKNIRNFYKSKNKTKLSKTILSNSEKLGKEPQQRFNLLKPFAFTVLFSGTTFIGAIIWEYENARKISSLYSNFKQWGVHRTGWRKEINDWWNKLTDGHKTYIAICFLNVVIFLAWRIPSFHPALLKYFATRPLPGGSSLSMLFSVFSHMGFFHLLLNMYILNIFCHIPTALLGKEQFCALYLASGVISSFASILYKVAIGSTAYSLGASGAIMGVVGYMYTAMPNLYYRIIFTPWDLQGRELLKIVIGLEIALALLLPRLKIDHAAHLAGIFFGMFWQSWGNANIWQKREPVLTFWHQLREPPKS